MNALIRCSYIQTADSVAVSPFRSFFLSRPDLARSYSTSRSKGEATAQALGAKFLAADIEQDDLGLTDQDFSGIDLIVHTAGPFQRRKSVQVAEAAIKASKQERDPYFVCVCVCERTCPLANPLFLFLSF